MRFEFKQIIGRAEDVRAELGLSTQEFSKSLKMFEHTYFTYIGVTGATPSVELIFGLSEAHSVSLEWLLHGRGPMFKRAACRDCTLI